MDVLFFFPSNFPQKKGEKRRQFGGNFAKTSCLGWLLKPEFFLVEGRIERGLKGWLLFFFCGKPLVFQYVLVWNYPYLFFSSCFQSSYKHPQIRKITPCKVVTMKHGGHLSSGQLENKLGGLYILFISRSNSTKPPSTQNIKQFEHLLETWKSLIHSCTTRRNPRRLTMIRRKKQLNLGTPPWF